MQFNGQDHALMQKALRDAGLDVIEYVPDNAYLVRGTPQAAAAVQASGLVRWSGPLQPAWRIAPRLLREAIGDEVAVLILLYPGEDSALVRKAIDRQGGQVLRVSDTRDIRIKAVLPAADVRDTLVMIAGLDEVRWIDRFPKFQLCNDNTSWIGQTGPGGLGAVPYYDAGLRGEGQVIAFSDTGLDFDMCYFYDAVAGAPGELPDPSQRKVLSYQSWVEPNDWDGGETGHGTHVCGTIAGDDETTPGQRDIGDGMAPAAKVVVQDVALEDYLFGIPYDLTELFGRAAEDGAVMSTNSWTEPYDYTYTTFSRDVDEFMWANPEFLICFAVGNNGPFLSTIGMPSTAKSCLTVGATGGGRDDSINITMYSSHGPTEDGRLKPDIATCGGSEIEYVWSAENDWFPDTYNCGLSEKEGTSMACPAACGFAALARQYFAEGFYPAGAASAGNGFTPSAALLKALIVNSGVNITGYFTGDDGYFDPPRAIPTNGQGWGRLTLDRALYLAGQSYRLWVMDEQQGVGTNDVVEYSVSVSAGTRPLEISLVWTDFPGSLSSSVNLVNDLDLEVVRVDTGTVYKGNAYQFGYSFPGGTADRVNPVECCHINNPPAGRYIIRARGFSVPMGPQPFAVVATGALHFSNGTVRLDRKEYGCSATVAITLWDEDLSGSGSITVNVNSGADPSGENIVLTETSAGSGYFRGTAATTPATVPPAGSIRVVHGDTLTVAYTDANDGHGGVNVAKTASAEIDCIGPVISNVIAIDIKATTADIAWLTDEPADSSVAYGTLAPPGSLAAVPALANVHRVSLSGLSPMTTYLFRVASTDSCGNETTDNNGGSYYQFKTLELVTTFEDTLDTNPGWTISGGLWSYGQPTGQGGELEGGGVGSPDPTTGHTGANVYGYNLNGNYPYLTPAYSLTTPSFTCAAGGGVTLSYWRWLGVEGFIPILDMGDQARVQISTDNGFTWATVWWNDEYSFDDADWVEHVLDLSDYADHQATVRLRWVMGPTDDLLNMCGWNIDDVRVTYMLPHNGPNITAQSVAYDDIGGNGDGNPNPGESADMRVTLHNFGVTATNVSATLIPLSPHIHVLNSTLNYGTIPTGGTAAPPSPYFTFTIDADTPPGHKALLALRWQCAEGNGTMDFELTINPVAVPATGPTALTLLALALGVVLWRAMRGH